MNIRSERKGGVISEHEIRKKGNRHNALRSPCSTYFALFGLLSFALPKDPS